MKWFCSVCEKSFSVKDIMQRYVMSKPRNAGLTLFQTIPMTSKKCQRFRFEHPFTSLIAGMTGSGKLSGFTLCYNKLRKQFINFHRRGSFGVIHNGSPGKSPCHALNSSRKFLQL